MSQKPGNRFIYYPLILAATLGIGIYIGSTLSYGTAQVASRETVGSEKLFNLSFPSVRRTNKLNDILDYIENEYVDSVSRAALVDETIEHILQELDPHSYYISAAELQAMNEPLEGKFEGIGVQFLIQKDTVVVISPVAGGPSEKVGIQSGDRIVAVNGELIAGNGITNRKVMDLLRGERGSSVDVGVQRQGDTSTVDFRIVRDQIPIHSVEVAYKLTEEVGYIKISRFAKTTYDEFLSAVNKLEETGMQSLVLDLRGNGGGLLETATDLVDEFLEEGRLIVYTEGRARKRQTYYAHDEGKLTDAQLVVLIDEGSASASEIVAGAVQDNDRGTIIGKRSFGKGLVQEQSGWPDGSATRLTIARYYTPTGRCIQKPYDPENKNQFEGFFEALGQGETPNADSSSFPDSLIFTTPGGKTVYGGGGIVPDIYVGDDTTGLSYYLSEVAYRGLINRFAFEHVDQNRDAFARFEGAEDFVAKFDVTKQLLESFYDYAAETGTPRNEDGIRRSEKRIRARVKAQIGRNLFNNEAFYPVLYANDPAMLRALRVIEAQKKALEDQAPF